MAYPGVDLRLDTIDRLVDLAREGIALGVRYRAGPESRTRYQSFVGEALGSGQAQALTLDAAVRRTRRPRRREARRQRRDEGARNSSFSR